MSLNSLNRRTRVDVGRGYVCGGLHDSYGFHPGTCRAGNMYGLWTLRHDAVQLMLVYVVRRLGFQALSCSAGAGK